MGVANPKNREFFALRIDADLLRRVKNVANSNRTNARVVIEQCLDAHLTSLEGGALRYSTSPPPAVLNDAPIVAAAESAPRSPAGRKPARKPRRQP
jgi:hypothetical protein